MTAPETPAARILREVVDPTLAKLRGMGVRSDDRARVLLLAISGQEAAYTHRVQLVGNPPKPIGPAHGLWQFERGGGVKGVLTHPVSAPLARKLVAAAGLTFEAQPVWEALAKDDTLACAFARLLLLTDPAPLPGLDQPNTAWDYYVRCWRPGKPHRETWAGRWRDAVVAVGATPA